jgi:hypothetical protein
MCLRCACAQSQRRTYLFNKILLTWRAHTRRVRGTRSQLRENEYPVASRYFPLT